MDIYLVPHADGDAGRRHAKAVARLFDRMGIAPDRIFRAPLPDSRRTADGLVLALVMAPSVTECALLAPGADAAELSRHIRDSGGKAVTLVGGEPELSAYAGRLLGYEGADLDLEDGTVAAISFTGQLDDGQGVLVWAIPSAEADRELTPPA